MLPRCRLSSLHCLFQALHVSQLTSTFPFPLCMSLASRSALLALSTSARMFASSSAFSLSTLFEKLLVLLLPVTCAFTMPYNILFSPSQFLLSSSEPLINLRPLICSWCVCPTCSAPLLCLSPALLSKSSVRIVSGETACSNAFRKANTSHILNTFLTLTLCRYCTIFSILWLSFMIDTKLHHSVPDGAFFPGASFKERSMSTGQPFLLCILLLHPVRSDSPILLVVWCLPIHCLFFFSVGLTTKTLPKIILLVLVTACCRCSLMSLGISNLILVCFAFRKLVVFTSFRATQ